MILLEDIAAHQPDASIIPVAVDATDTVAVAPATGGQLPAVDYAADTPVLLGRAQAAVAYLGGDPASVRIRSDDQARVLYAFFEASLPDGDYFIKVARSARIAERWEERDNAVFAAAQGWGPGAIAPEAYPDVLMTRLILGDPLSWHEVAQPDVWPELLRAIKQVHDTFEPTMPDTPPDLASGARGRLGMLRDSERPEILNLQDLEHRVDAIGAELQRVLVPNRYCHRDFHQGNVLSDGNRLWIIDWEYSGWDNPLYEIARFGALAHMPSSKAHALLSVYYAADPAPWEVRYVQLCMAALNIEFFTHRYRLNGLTPDSTRYMEAVLRDAAFIVDLPDVRITGR